MGHSLFGLFVKWSSLSLPFDIGGKDSRGEKAFGNRESRCREGKIRKKLFLWLGSKSSLKTQNLILSANHLLAIVCLFLSLTSDFRSK